jgi:tetratricopeptide (TPR) repeat protein
MKTRLLALGCALLLLCAGTAMAAPPPLTGPAYELADQAYKALAAKNLSQALELTTQALQAAPNHPSLLLLQADILSQQGKTAEAVARVRGLSAAELGGAGLAQRGYLWLKAEDAAAAQADFEAAMNSGELTSEQRRNLATELAYLALRRKDDAAAVKWFRAALGGAPPGSTAGIYADAGYAALRAGRNREASELLAKAVDAWHAAPQDKKPFDEHALYGMRRTIATLERRWGATFSLGSGTLATAASGLGAVAGDARVVQAGAEVFYQPEGFGFRNGRVFQLYANGFQSVWSNDESVVTGSEARVAGLGARYKPFEQVNLVFGLERRIAIGDQAGEDDWVLRAGWSAGGGTDWDPVRTWWPTWQVYTESAYFTKAKRLIQPFDARVGSSFKLERSYGTVITPFFGIAGEYDEAQLERTAAGIGPGVVVRHWFRDSRHQAFASYVDVSLQIRKRVTDAKRGSGLFASVSVTF